MNGSSSGPTTSSGSSGSGRSQAGSVDILAMLDWLVNNAGYLPQGSAESGFVQGSLLGSPHAETGSQLEPVGRALTSYTQ
jgi:hypothetical protein